jgi:hypothetical protein
LWDRSLPQETSRQAAMPITPLTDEAVEKSTYIINCAFTDEEGYAVIPDSLDWTLSDESGTWWLSTDHHSKKNRLSVGARISSAGGSLSIIISIPHHSHCHFNFIFKS